MLEVDKSQHIDREIPSEVQGCSNIDFNFEKIKEMDGEILASMAVDSGRKKLLLDGVTDGEMFTSVVCVESCSTDTPSSKMPDCNVETGRIAYGTVAFASLVESSTMESCNSGGSVKMFADPLEGSSTECTLTSEKRKATDAVLEVELVHEKCSTLPSSGLCPLRLI
jgi:hypothetical protein